MIIIIINVFIGGGPFICLAKDCMSLYHDSDDKHYAGIPMQATPCATLKNMG